MINGSLRHLLKQEEICSIYIIPSNIKIDAKFQIVYNHVCHMSPLTQ